MAAGWVWRSSRSKTEYLDQVELYFLTVSHVTLRFLQLGGYRGVQDELAVITLS